ncbi:hypothetical protein GWK47_039348 [Chionoecetes opilio]|uniref:Uncharacterized protein n=1 Tax=Chionoecetes opilio TaxID=41210 RepID=A0A8J5CLN6_CHIOP|nr:hypothetical protein GWK47_039348 [Chionoecetes opilio]
MGDDGGSLISPQEKHRSCLISMRHHPSHPYPTHFWTGRCCLCSRWSTFSALSWERPLLHQSRQEDSHQGRRQGELRQARLHLLTLGVSQPFMRPKSAPHGVSPPDWSSCPPLYLGLLDKVQNRAQRLNLLKAAQTCSRPLQSLQHRRDVAGLGVTYKILKQGAPHLAILPGSRGRHLTHNSTRDAHKRDNNQCSLRQDRDLFRSFLHDTAGCGTV